MGDVNRFRDVYKKNLWMNKESRSGNGSTRRNAAADIKYMVKVITTLCVGLTHVSIADIPCGDMNWMPLMLHKVRRTCNVTYTGYDIVPDIIESNRQRIPSERFVEHDIVSQPLPRHTDIIISRDLVNHLNISTIQRVLYNIKATKPKLLLISNNKFQGPNEELFGDGGASRVIDITKQPFNWPLPMHGNGHMSTWTFARG